MIKNNSLRRTVLAGITALSLGALVAAPKVNAERFVYPINPDDPTPILQATVNIAASGDTIIVRRGAYPGYARIPGNDFEPSKNLTFIGDQDSTSTLYAINAEYIIQARKGSVVNIKDIAFDGLGFDVTAINYVNTSSGLVKNVDIGNIGPVGRLLQVQDTTSVQADSINGIGFVKGVGIVNDANLDFTNSTLDPVGTQLAGKTRINLSPQMSKYAVSMSPATPNYQYIISPSVYSSITLDNVNIVDPYALAAPGLMSVAAVNPLVTNASQDSSFATGLRVGGNICPADRILDQTGTFKLNCPTTGVPDGSQVGGLELAVQSPSRGSTPFSFRNYTSLPQRADAKVFDVAGRMVWDGNDVTLPPGGEYHASPRLEHSGLYFLRGELGDQTAVKRLVNTK